MKGKLTGWFLVVSIALLVLLVLAIILRKMRVETAKVASTSKNVNAFLDMIIKCEGGAYNALFGYPKAGRTFSDFSKHPAIFFDYTDKAGKKLRTSAAGAFQITYTTYKALRLKYGLPADFSPAAQRLMAILLIGEKSGALEDIEAGRLTAAIAKVRKIWASLPGSGNNQPERSLSAATGYYLNAGGQIAA